MFKLAHPDIRPSQLKGIYPSCTLKTSTLAQMTRDMVAVYSIQDGERSTQRQAAYRGVIVSCKRSLQIYNEFKTENEDVP